MKRAKQIIMTIVISIFSLNSILSAQTIPWQSVYSAGTTTGPAAGGNYKLYSSIGQPIVIQSTPPTAAASNAGFMQVVNEIVRDNQKPEILLFETPTLTKTKGAESSIKATVTDNYTLEPAVTLFHKKIADENFTALPLTMGENNVYSTVINDAWYDEMGVEYYFYAKDIEGNESTTAHQIVPLKNTDVVLPNNLRPHNGYQILSVPYEINVSNNGINDIFIDLPDPDKTQYRVWIYETSEPVDKQWVELPQSGKGLERGKGFFMIRASGLSLKGNKLGERLAPINDRGHLFEMTLKPGWNLIGNPYTVPINWQDVQMFNKNLDASIDINDLKLYNGGYTIATDVAPLQGGFIKWEGIANQTILIPFKGQITNEGGRKSSENFTSNLGEGKWRVDFFVTKAELINGLAGFGMHPEASIDTDRFDDHNPPHFEQFVEVNFLHPEHPLKKICRDVVTTQDEYVWNFTVDGDVSEETSITWDNSNFGSNTKELYLYDESNNQVVNMREQNVYTFKSSQSNVFKVYFGVDVHRKIVPEKLYIGAPYPNPLLSEKTVTFDLAMPDGLDHYTVTVDIINTQGLKMGSSQKQIRPGREKFVMDLAKSNLSTGIHYYRMVITSSNFKQIVNGKLIIP